MIDFTALRREDMELALKRLEHLAVHQGTPQRIADDLGIVIGLAREEFKRLYPSPSPTEG